MILRTGIDLLEITRLAAVKPSIRQRFLQRVYTEQELEEANNSFQALAGKFAAKEAVAKALGTGIGPVRWQEIEILHGNFGEPVLLLHGNAVKIAAEIGITQWSISISHSQTHAVAIAVAIGNQ